MLKSKDAHPRSNVTASELPVLECLWNFGTKANLTEETMKAIAFLSRERDGPDGPGGGSGKGMVGMTTYKSGVELFRDLLMKNRKRLDRTYREAMEKDVPAGVQFSLLSPVEAMVLNTEACAACNIVVHRLRRCAGCFVPGYCSKACQKSHWSTHKQSCRKKAPQNSELALVDLSLVDGTFMGSQGPGMMTASFSLGTVGGGACHPTDVNTKIPANLLGKKVVVKVQVPTDRSPMAGMFDQMVDRVPNPGCMIYDESRTWTLQATAKNTPTGYDAMCQMVREHGERGGLKAYFTAYLPSTPDGIVKIEYKKVLRAQLW